MARIAVLDYGAGNLHSVSRALAVVGADVVVTADADDLDDADVMVIPGVGRFGACVRALRASGLEPAAREFIDGGRPVFGVCLGMQILFEGSDEDPEPGLGVFSGRVRRLSDQVRVPHMGWNTVEWTRTHPYLQDVEADDRFYFVHSYAAFPGNEETLGVTGHGWSFASAVERDNVFATQFHPEKSGDAGLRIYANVVKAVA
jgi:imidazole glycerol-phosphate synthase subunit HisH